LATVDPPHLYSSTSEAALTGALDTGSPCYSSELHLGRPFVLTDDGFFWGHYAANANRGIKPQAYRTAPSTELAVLFCTLLMEQQSDVVKAFERESAALRAYYTDAAPIDRVLAIVFDAARHLHKVQKETFRYVGLDRGVHIASVWDAEDNEFYAFFDEQLVLTQVSALCTRPGQLLHDWPSGRRFDQ